MMLESGLVARPAPDTCALPQDFERRCPRTPCSTSVVERKCIYKQYQ